ncbi:DNA-binding response regulator [Sphingomonas sp. DBB INV C78]
MRCGVRALIETRAGWEVVAEASDGHTAIGLAAATLPDLVITDYLLPRLNGLELTRRLKQAFPDIPVLIYTMHDREDIALEALRAGARGYVFKTDTAAQLMEAIEVLSTGSPYFTGSIAESLLDQFQSSARAELSTPLTRREVEIVELVAAGRTNREISGLLDIRLKTVESHRLSAMDRLNVKGTAELVRYAVRNGLIEA